MHSDNLSSKATVSAEDIMSTVKGEGFEVEEVLTSKQSISPKEVLQQAGLKGKKGRVKNLTAQQHIGVWLALGVGGMIGLVLLVLVLVWMCIMVKVPSITKVEDYTALMNAVTEASTKIFDLVIFKALLPVFTGIIGVLLGRALPREKQ